MLLTAKQVAIELKTTPKKVRNLIRLGLIRSIPSIGSKSDRPHRYTTLEWVKEFIDQRAEGGKKTPQKRSNASTGAKVVYPIDHERYLKNKEDIYNLRQSSPERWLTQLLISTKKANKKRFGIDPIDNLNIEFLLYLWNKQNGKCSITNLEMKHEFNNLLSASIDRIDSKKGYLKDNVHLVCQWVNYAKSDGSLEEITGILNEFIFSKTVA